MSLSVRASASKGRIFTLDLYKPHAKQMEFHNSKKRFRVAVLGRQAGKTTMCLNEVFMRAWERPKTNYWFILPTHGQARVVFLRALSMFPIGCGLYRRKPNEQRLDLPLINGSTVRCVSGASFDNLRNETLHGVIIDEMRYQPRGLWTTVISPMLATTGGWAAFVSTPQGFDDFHDLYVTAQTDSSGDWFCMHAPSTCNPLFTSEEFESQRKSMSEPEFAQEILAEFRNLTQGTAYFNFGDWNIRDNNPFGFNSTPIHPHMPVDLYPDFNVLPMGWTLAQFGHGRGHHFFDEIFLQTRSNTEEACRELIVKLKDLPTIQAKPQIRICGDATGKAQKTSSAGETDYSIIFAALKEAGFTFSDHTPDSNPRVKDRVNTVNSRLRAADGSVQVTFDRTHCKATINDMYKVVWKRGASAILDQTTYPELTHLSDTVGYGICAFNPMKELRDVGTLRVIRR